MTSVLVVGDEPDVLYMTGLLLKLDGYAVFEAPSAEEALAVLDAEAIDVMLLDLQLPGMNGAEFLAHLREAGRLDDLQVIALSAHASGDTRRKLEEGGAAGYVVKPFTREALGAAIESSLEDPRRA